MTYKILIPNNSDGTFTFTKEDLEKLLDDVYNEGYFEGSKNKYYYPITYPSITPNPIINPTITYNGPYDVLCTNDNRRTYTTVTTARNESNS